VAGGVLPLRGGQIPPLQVIISNAILCGFFGIVGGGISSYFLPGQNNIIMLASGVFCSCIVSLFSNEEIKLFLRDILQKIVTLVLTKFKF
jgi:hypothetical protein